MSGGEFEGIVGREIRGKDALVDASPAEDLAGSARADNRGRCWTWRRRRRGRRGGGRRGRGWIMEGGGGCRVTCLHGRMEREGRVGGKSLGQGGRVMKRNDS